MGHGETFLGMPITLACLPLEIWSDHVIVATDEIVITSVYVSFSDDTIVQI